MPMYAKISGIEGYAEDVGHEGWHILTSYGTGMANRAQDSNKMQSGEVEPKSITLSRAIDGASAILLTKCTLGEVLDEMEIHVCAANASRTVMHKMVLHKVRIIDVNQTFDAQGDGTETVTLVEVVRDWSFRKPDGVDNQGKWNSRTKSAS